MSPLEYLSHMAEIYDRGPAAFLEHDRSSCAVCDAYAGVQWFNGLKEPERATWLHLAWLRNQSRSGRASYSLEDMPTPADAWDFFKSSRWVQP